MMPHARALLAIWSATALIGCQNEAKDAQAKYEIVQRTTGDAKELCKRARAVANIYLEKRDEQNYVQWSRMAEIDCADVSAKATEAR